MADIIDEILNDVKDEKRLVLFRKSLPIIIAVTFIITVFIAVYGWYNNKVEEHNKNTGDELFKLISDKNLDKDDLIAHLDDIIKTKSNNQVELAEIKIASELISSQQTQLAEKRLESIISNKNYQNITTDFARLLWISLVLDQDNISSELTNKIDDYFQYFKDSKQAFFANATLIKALFYKNNGKNNLALEQANILLNSKDESIPLAIKEQARAVISNINRTN